MSSIIPSTKCSGLKCNKFVKHFPKLFLEECRSCFESNSHFGPDSIRKDFQSLFCLFNLAKAICSYESESDQK